MDKQEAGEKLKVSFDVQNTAGVGGDEVAELYITDIASSVPVPIRSLCGIQRIYLKPGEKRSVSFTISPNQMSIIDDNGKRVIEPGEFLISAGGKQPGFTGSADAETTSAVTKKFNVIGKVAEVAEQ